MHALGDGEAVALDADDLARVVGEDTNRGQALVGQNLRADAVLAQVGLEDKGLDTVQANLALGLKPDLREYGIGAQILADQGLTTIRILTKNPRKIVGIEGYGLTVAERVHLQMPSTKHTAKYLNTKREKLGHLLTVREELR